MTEAWADSPQGEKSQFQLSREMELLISAALVFVLFQFPTILDNWWDRAQTHVGGTSFGTIFTMYYAAKLISYGLIAAIVTHFLLRGFWVAVMGLRSVFPSGVHREKLDQGDVLQTFYDTHLPTLDELESRVDRIAASIFSFVFLFLTIFFVLVAWSGAAWMLAFIITRITGTEFFVRPTLIAVFLVFVALQSFVVSVDKTSKKRLIAPRTKKLALRIMKFLHYATLNFLYAPLFFTLASHTSRRKMSALLMIFLYSMIGFFMVSVLQSRGALGFDSYIYYPSQAREQQLRAVHYDSIRGTALPASEPTIQSDLIVDPYIRLFIPYDAREDNARMRALCPGVKPLRSDGMFFMRRGKLDPARVNQLSSCFDKVYDIALDGRPLSGLQFVFHRHPQGRTAGRLALIPATTLPPGRHLLTVKHARLPGIQKDDEADEYYIPFWR